MRCDDEYHLVAPLYGVDAEELRARDARLGQPVMRWVLMDGSRAAATAATLRRPDDRTFLRFVGDPEGWEELTRAAIADLGAPVYAHVGGAHDREIDVLARAGFVVEASTESFRVPFADLASWLGRRWNAPSFTITSAADADHDLLFALDNEIRRDVIGTDGWRGDRKWFDDEMQAVEFAPEGYLVAASERNGEYAGLIRFWHNPAGPSLGLLGVLPQYRRSTLAVALLQRGAAAAAGWGHDSFVTETSLEQRVRHPRLVELGARSLGRSFQMIRPGRV